MSGGRPPLCRRVGKSIAAGLFVVAAAVLVVMVDVHAGTRSVSCGSGWDVAAGRAGWRQWWAQDQADPVAGAPLVRTDDCVGAVNAHIVAAAVLALVALAVVTACAFGGAVRRSGGPRTRPVRRLQLLGAVVTVFGIVLCAAGLAGIALLAADPAAPLFTYVSRATVVLLGLLLLTPAVLLVVLGRGARVLAEQLDRNGSDDERRDFMLGLVAAAVGGCARRAPPWVRERRARFGAPFALPPPTLDGAISLQRALALRRSRREYRSDPLPLDTVGQLLWAGQGITSTDGKRTAPSAGALYPLELYAVTPSQVMHYVPVGHRIEVRATADLRGQPRADAFVEREVGHAAQNILLSAAALDLAAVPVGSVDGVRAAISLALPPGERVHYLMPVGRRRA